MVVIALESCPTSLRGDLTKWLQEISLGVYVGHVSARVRDKLWDRVCKESKSGRATMVFSARNEQHYDFRVHNTTWEPIDFDGIKLMMRPGPSRIMEARATQQAGNSNAAKRRKRRFKSTVIDVPSEYVAIDIETTGLDPCSDEIIELGAIRIVNGTERDSFNCTIKPTAEVPKQILSLTGFSLEDLASGKDAEQAFVDFVDFLGYSPIIAHNAEFDMAFLQNALIGFDLDDIENEVIDTLELAKTKYPQLGSYQLAKLASYFKINVETFHRALPDAKTVHHLFLKLNE